MRDLQSEIIAQLLTLLAGVPLFGALVFEDSVLRIIDSSDDSLPDDCIVIQPGQTEELERAGVGSVRERVTLNITAITRRRDFAPALRAARLAIKSALAGRSASLTVANVQSAAFQTETPMPPGEGRRWACHVLPLQVTYIQPYT